MFTDLLLYTLACTVHEHSSVCTCTQWCVYNIYVYRVVCEHGEYIHLSTVRVWVENVRKVFLSYS